VGDRPIEAVDRRVGSVGGSSIRWGTRSRRSISFGRPSSKASP